MSKSPATFLGPPPELIRAINDLLPAYVAYVDADLRYLAANRMYMERFGRSEDEIVGRRVAEVTGSAFENVAHHLKAALAGHVQHFEPHMNSIDGDRILSVTHLPHRDKNGNVIGIIVYGYDITEQRRAEAALIQSEKLAAVGRLASSIAHEINNPLESVTNLLYLLERTIGNDPEQAKVYVEIAQRELARVSLITTQTLRFFKQSTSRQPAQVAELADSVLSLYKSKLVNAHVDVSREYHDRVELVCFDGEVRQILNNLIGNAIDALRDGGGRLRVRIRWAKDHATGRKGARITVADTGSGIDTRTREKIFEPFFTTKGARGTGLGLWITLELVNKSEGRLRLRSRQSSSPHMKTSRHGTVVALFLPGLL